MESELNSTNPEKISNLVKMNVFEAKTYHEVIRMSLLANENVRGFQSRLSEAAGCTTSYFSRVLCGRYHLNLEQGFSLCQFWGLNKKETGYFLLLILFARSGSSGLKNQIETYLSCYRDTSAPAFH